MEESNFFGIGTNSSFYDKRRHINIVFIGFLSYRLYVNPSIADKILSIVRDSYRSTKDKAIDICNDILSYDEHNYLNLLRAKVQISESEFLLIMSGIGIGKETKSPAGYTREQNIALLVNLIIAREFMRPRVEEAFLQSDNAIIYLAKAMLGAALTNQNAGLLFSLTHEAMLKYQTNYALQQMEEYVISKWK